MLNDGLVVVDGGKSKLSEAILFPELLRKGEKLFAVLCSFCSLIFRKGAKFGCLMPS